MRSLRALFAVYFLLMLQFSNAQIFTRRIENGSLQTRITTGLTSNPLLSVKSLAPSKGDILAALKTDSIEHQLGGYPFRFGLSLNADYSLADGVWTDVPGGKVWQIQISSPGAHSLNFWFDKFRLSKGSELTLYNADRTMQMGPITDVSNNLYNNLATDLIQGSSVIIELFEPESTVNTKEASVLHLARFTHGYRNMFPTYNAGFGESLPCHINANCPEGSAFQSQTNSVAMVLLANQTRWCSSTLLSTACQNFRPYMLTAFHCLDTGNGTASCDDADFENGTLSENEINIAQGYVFRFQYKSPNCTSSEPAYTVSFSGAALRASNFNSDFALLELNQRPTAGTGIRYAGWNRNPTVSSSGAILHHPNGDVMKVSTFNTTPTLLPVFGINLCDRRNNYPANSIWRLTLNQGAIQGGSSGAGLLGSDGRVFGQVTSGIDQCGSNDKEGGALHVSWTGGGTPNTRLSDWLDPTNTGAMTSDEAITIPSVAGPSFFCTAAQFTLTNVPAGVPVTWSVSQPSPVQPSSGAGNAANVNATAGADATITFFVGCANPSPFSFNFHAGDYTPPSYTAYGPTNAGCGQLVQYTTNTLPGASSYIWSWPSGWTPISGQNSQTLQIYAGSPGVVGIRVGACGGQGGSPSYVYTSTNCGGRSARYSVYPNPSSDLVQVEFDQTDEIDVLPDRIDLYSEKSLKPVRTVNVKDLFDKKALRDGNKVELDVRGLPSGVYYIHLNDPNQKSNTTNRVRIILN